MPPRARPLAALLALSAGGCAPPAFEEVTGFGSNPGALRMFVHAPAGRSDPAPLLLALHGCTQDHTFADDAGLVDLADARGFVLVSAEQRLTNNPQGCFDWFTAADNTRDAGEVLSLKQMVDAEEARAAIDATRVYSAGLSAGGAMTTALLATWPDVFAGGAIAAGAPYGCTDTVADAAACATGTLDLSQAEWAARVTDASDHDGQWPRVLVLQGDDDPIAPPALADAIVRQWTGVHGLPEAPTTTDTFTTARGTATVRGFGPAGATDGDVDVAEIRYAGVGHAFPVDPDAGCGTAVPFLVDIDDCAATRIADFLGL